MDSPFEPNLEQLHLASIQLQVERVAAQYGIDRRSLTLSVRDDDVFGMVLVRLVRMVATVPGQESLRVPVTWWDALKVAEEPKSPIMRWWVRRHPVRWRVWRALEVIPNFPELDRWRGMGPRVARWVES